MRKRSLFLIFFAMLSVPGLAGAMSCGADAFQEFSVATWSEAPAPGFLMQDEALIAHVAPLPSLWVSGTAFGAVPLRLFMGDPHGLTASLDAMRTGSAEGDISQIFMRNTGNPALAWPSMKSETARQLRILLSALDRMG